MTGCLIAMGLLIFIGIIAAIMSYVEDVKISKQYEKDYLEAKKQKDKLLEDYVVVINKMYHSGNTYERYKEFLQRAKIPFREEELLDESHRLQPGQKLNPAPHKTMSVLVGKENNAEVLDLAFKKYLKKREKIIDSKADELIEKLGN